MSSIKIHICDVKKPRLGHDLPLSENDSDFGISRGFYFHKTSNLQYSGSKLFATVFNNFTGSRRLWLGLNMTIAVDWDVGTQWQ